MMALSDLAIYSDFVYSTMVEVVDQYITLFNEASDNTILLRAIAHRGDYSDMVFWAKTSGLIRRRDPTGTGSVSLKSLAQHVNSMVKVAAGTPPVDLSPGQFRWIQANPQDAGVILGQQLAGDVLQDMINTTVGSVNAAMLGIGANITYDISAFTDGTNANSPTGTMFASPLALSNAAGKFGDRGGAINAWIMHSKVLFDLYANALTNHERLFSYGNVNVGRDPFGRRYICSDIPALKVAGSPNKYHTLGLVQGAAMCDQNDDYDQQIVGQNGFENLLRTFQAEWSYELGMKGMTWDKGNGGPHPTDSALFTASNWDQTATSLKDTMGVMLVSQ